MKLHTTYWIAVIILWISSLGALVYDNRYWILYPHQFLSYQAYPHAHLYALGGGIFIGSDVSVVDDTMITQSLDSEGNNENADLFSIFGQYDQVVINNALQKAGRTSASLLPPQFDQLNSIPWSTPGKTSLRGCVLAVEGYIHEYCGFGASWFVGKMHANEASILCNSQRYASGDINALHMANMEMRTALETVPSCYEAAVFGDIDLYTRGRITVDYWCKMHHLDIGLRVGGLLPSGIGTLWYNPASLPVGGNGHWGLYVQSDGNFLLNDLLSAGYALQVIHRFSRTSIQRMPVLTEPTNFGALVAPARISPGITVVFNPYVQVGGLRGGLGCVGAYYLVHHAPDRWCVSDLIAEQFDPNLALLRERSAWGRDHFSVTLFYDFGYERACSYSAPIVSLTIDIPWSGGPVTRMVNKSHALSLRIETRI